MMTQVERYPRIPLTTESEYWILGERVRNDSLVVTLGNYWQYREYLKNSENELSNFWCWQHYLLKHRDFLWIVGVPNYLIDFSFIGCHGEDRSHFLGDLVFHRPFLR